MNRKCDCSAKINVKIKCGNNFETFKTNRKNSFVFKLTNIFGDEITFIDEIFFCENVVKHNFPTSSAFNRTEKYLL